jgi:recombination protein RecT
METQALTIKNLFGKDEVRSKFQELLGKKSQGFITSVLQVVSQNHLLQKADPHSVYHAAAVAAVLDLPLNPNLGFAYIIPYSQKQADGSYKQVAQFQMGYKGYIQLAQRSGQFKSIGATRVFEGQLIKDDPLYGPTFDWDAKKSDLIIGYAAAFSLVNGFEKVTYTSHEKLKEHGLRFSQTFKKGYGLWKDDFDSMAVKTVLKLLLSKFAPLSIEMQKAVVVDQAVISDTTDTDAIELTYADNQEQEPVEINKEAERVVLMISEAKSIPDLNKILPHVKPEQQELFNQKLNELKK